MALTRCVAYVAYWDQPRGFASIDANPGAVTEISPWWYSLDSSGNIRLQEPGATQIDRERVSALQGRGLQVTPTISNHQDGAWNDSLIPDLLQSPSLVTTHVRSIVDLAVKEGYDGIDIDYENLPADSRQEFSQLIAELSNGLHQRGKTLSVDLHAKVSDAGVDDRNIAQDYAGIGSEADQVRIMAYDYHWQDSRPGPIAPTDWVEKVIRYTVSQVPKEKVVIGVPLFGYDWPGDGSAQVITWQEAQDRTRAHSVVIQRDVQHAAPWFRYSDTSGRQHTVWFEDEVSISAKLHLISKYGVSGVFFWRAGGEQPATWPIVRSLLRRS